MEIENALHEVKVALALTGQWFSESIVKRQLKVKKKEKHLQDAWVVCTIYVWEMEQLLLDDIF